MAGASSALTLAAQLSSPLASARVRHSRSHMNDSRRSIPYLRLCLPAARLGARWVREDREATPSLAAGVKFRKPTEPDCRCDLETI